MDDCDMEKYHPSRVIQGFVFLRELYQVCIFAGI